MKLRRSFAAAALALLSAPGISFSPASATTPPHPCQALQNHALFLGESPEAKAGVRTLKACVAQLETDVLGFGDRTEATLPPLDTGKTLAELAEEGWATEDALMVASFKASLADLKNRPGKNPFIRKSQIFAVLFRGREAAARYDLPMDNEFYSRAECVVQDISSFEGGYRYDPPKSCFPPPGAP